MTGSTSNQRIDGRRLWATLMTMAEIGATAKGGVRRVALSDVDKAGRAQFRSWCESAGLSVRTDEMGNIFARREGRDPSQAPVLFGSHLDSQPNGGKFDGALGVIAGLEVMRTLQDLGIETDSPVELVNWTDEEGARFGKAMMGSGVWAGAFSQGETEALRDETGISLGEALDSIGARGEAPARHFAADSYFELHIEQGPILEREGKTIGVVTGGQAQIWYDVVVIGQDSHAGTTPPEARRDALVGAARIIELVDRTMRARGELGRGTVGQLSVLPNSRNVIPGEVRCSVEFRHPDECELDRLAVEFRHDAGVVAAELKLELSLMEKVRIRAQPFDPACVALVRDAAAHLGYSSRDMVSGAGHDAIFIAPVIPSAMIFVPCQDGLSHNEAESITPADAEAGCQLLLAVVLARACAVSRR